MIQSIFNKTWLIAIVLFFSVSAFSWTPTPTPDPNPDPTPCDANCNFERGPDPSTGSLEADQGPYSVSTISVSRSVSGFGGGTIYYPTGTNGTMAAITIAPGFSATQSSIGWWGPRIASHGFVVFTIDTNSVFDFPSSRSQQLSAALDYVINQSNSSSSAIAGLVDASRLGAMGWSMGGGGSLGLAADRNLQAAIPLAPWNTGSNDFNTIATPTLIMACENDSVAPVNAHASSFYDRIPSVTDKALLEVRGGNHSCANGGGSNAGMLGKYGVAWMKRFLDVDRRYDQFLCGPNHAGNSAIASYLETCDY